jgi:hypothetical protein
MRVSAKKRFKTLICVISAGASLALPRAAEAHVDNRCPGMASADYDELDARVMLLLTAGRSTRPLPSVVCSAQATWVEWDGRRFDVTGRLPLADEVVDIIESALASDAPASLGGRKLDVPPLLPPPEARPDLRVTFIERVRRARTPRSGGGVALALENELPAALSAALGPSFEFGTSVGPFVLGAREAFRFATSGPRIVLMDFEAALSYGAPLQLSQPFGVVTRFGAACMWAYRRVSAPAQCAPTAALGVRAARGFGNTAVWIGLDARWRMATLRVGGQDAVTANDIAASFSLGVSFLDLKRRDK